MPLKPPRSRQNTPPPQDRGGGVALLAPNLPWSKAAPGLRTNSPATPGLHMPKDSWAGSSSHPCDGRSPRQGKMPVEQLAQCRPGYPIFPGLPYQAPWNKKVWCEKTIRERSHSIPRAPQEPEPASGCTEGLWMLIQRAPPQDFWLSGWRVGAGANISSTFSIWA